MGMRWQPSLQIIPHYESEPLYIQALKNSITTTLKKLKWKPDVIVASYHGIPKKVFYKRRSLITAIVKKQHDY